MWWVSWIRERNPNNIHTTYSIGRVHSSYIHHKIHVSLSLSPLRSRGIREPVSGCVCECACVIRVKTRRSVSEFCAQRSSMMTHIFEQVYTSYVYLYRMFACDCVCLSVCVCADSMCAVVAVVVVVADSSEFVNLILFRQRRRVAAECLPPPPMNTQTSRDVVFDTYDAIHTRTHSQYYYIETCLSLCIYVHPLAYHYSTQTACYTM